jgi:hypothetical protein
MLRAEKFLNVALQTRNSNLLDFILTHGDIDINNQSVSAHKKQYPSAVHACLQGNSPSNPMSECLSVLIKHGASLFAPDEKGLPLVYSILAGDTHPLRKTLLMNRSKTLESTDFLKKLIALLRAYLAQDNISTEEASSIELDLNSFEHQLEIVQNSQLDDPSTRFLKKRVNHLEEKYLQSLLSKLQKDPEVIVLNKKVQTAALELNSKYSKSQQRQAKISLYKTIEDLDKFLARVDIESLDFDTLKARLLEDLNNDLELIEKKSKLFEVQNEIKHYTVHGKGSRKYRENLRTQERLLKEIKELEKKNSLMQDFGAMEQSFQELDSITKTLETLNQSLESLKGMSALLNQFSSIFSSLTNSSTSSPGEAKEDKTARDEPNVEDNAGLEEVTPRFSTGS